MVAKLGPYEIRCDACWRLGRIVIFVSQAAYLAHLRSHWS